MGLRHGPLEKTAIRFRDGLHVEHIRGTHDLRASTGTCKIIIFPLVPTFRNFKYPGEVILL